jgi:uncharacterized protein YqjF (DUF2071 family)
MKRRPFLTAEWRSLAMLNYAVEPSALLPLVPRGTELDDWQGTTYVTVVGFLFLDTRVLRVPIPFHRSFEEVNLRLYVRREVAGALRRGVVFIREFVPRWAIAAVARAAYGENYASAPMRHHRRRASPSGGESISYTWEVAGRRNQLGITVDAAPQRLLPGSEEEFVAEHYWGYSAQRDGGTCEYEVEHPPWRAARASASYLDCDVRRVYGAWLEPFLRGEPASAFLAEGSAVSVHRGTRVVL